MRPEPRRGRWSGLSAAPPLLLTLVCRNRRGPCECDRRSAGPRMGTGTGEAGFLLFFFFPQAGGEEEECEESSCL